LGTGSLAKIEREDDRRARDYWESHCCDTKKIATQLRFRWRVRAKERKKETKEKEGNGKEKAAAPMYIIKSAFLKI
jgi:hypothetical protein